MLPDVITQVVFLTGQLLHSGTGRPVVGSLRAAILQGPVNLHLRDDGSFAISGDVRRLFPDLPTSNAPLTVTFEAISAQFRSGRSELTAGATLMAGSDFDPPTAAGATPPVSLGVLRFVGDPVVIRGRVTQARNPQTPIAGAEVRIAHGAADHVTNTDAQGWYSLDNIAIIGPATIRASAAGFGARVRDLLIDFTRRSFEEYFYLPPP